MNRTVYYNYIDEKLNLLAFRILNGGKLNMLSLHNHSENFYLHFFNLLYDYKLANLNKLLQNVEAIDLMDHENKIVIQVSSTNSKNKIENSLNKKIILKYSSYTFKFISIANNANNLRKNTFSNPHSINFDPINDIYDVVSILNKILSLDAEKQKNIYKFIKTELGNEIDIVKLDSNLALIINILAQEQWDESNKCDLINSFEIERKITYNNLDTAKTLIEEYSLYHGKVDAIYSEFDIQGSNKSNSVLATIKREYTKLKNNKNPDDIFYSVAKTIIEKILISANYNHIPIDELELCVDILVVDAFIRCKIFENPEGYSFVTS